MSGLQKNKKSEKTETQKAVAFVNWALPMADGSFLKASKGFTIFQNPQYPNKHEDVLVNLAQQHGGSVEVMLKCRIMINRTPDVTDLDLSSIQILPPAAPII